MRIKKGDRVKILAGKDKGKEGKVIRIFPENKKVSVEGVNVYKKHVRPKKQGEKGEIVDVTRPMPVSNVAVVCSACSKASKVGYKIAGGEKKRYCKKCDSEV